MNLNPELERLANIFNLEVIPAEINGDECLALANIRDTDKIIYGPVDDGELVDQQGILDYLREHMDDNSDDPTNLNLWDRENIGEYSDGNWETLFRMSNILSELDDLYGEKIDGIYVAVADEIMETLDKIITEIGDQL